MVKFWTLNDIIGSLLQATEMEQVHKKHWIIWHIWRGFEFLSQTNLENLF